MPSMDYEILSKLMRIVFMLLGVMIVWRTFAWLRSDRRETHRRLRELPDAGTIGLLTVLSGSSELPEGAIIPVPHEGVLGFVRTCDIVVPVTDVIAQHLDFTFRNGKGLYIYPRRGCPTTVDGVPLDSRAASRRYPMQHGSILCVGEAVLQLGVFAGLDVKQYGSKWPPPQETVVPEAVAPPEEFPQPAYPPQAYPQPFPPAPLPPEPVTPPAPLPPCPPQTDPYKPYYLQPPYPQTIPTEGRPGDDA